MVFAWNPSDSIYQTCYQRYRQADHQLLSSLPSYSRETAPRFFGHVARAGFQQDYNRVIEASLRPPSHWRRPCGRPRSTWLMGSTLMCSQLTLGSTQPGGKPVTVHCVDASSTWQHSIKGHATEERREERPDHWNSDIGGRTTLKVGRQN